MRTMRMDDDGRDEGSAGSGTALGLTLLALVLVPLLLIAAPARASEIADRARALIEAQPLPGTDVEIYVGEPDARLDLAACRRAEPFIPSGARLWGKTSLGVRCVDGATWTAFLPTQIKMFATGPVAARPIARGQPLTADDVRQDRIELTLFPPGAFASPEPPEGRVATRNIAAGEPLRRDLLRSRPVVQAGDQVRVVAAGPGFAVETEGKALATATEGQSVQVAVAGGRVVNGVARMGRIIEVQ